MNIRNPRKGTVLFPSPRETNSALSPTAYTPEVQGGKNRRSVPMSPPTKGRRTIGRPRHAL